MNALATGRTWGRTWLLALLCLGFAACGGGGDSASGPSVSPPPLAAPLVTLTASQASVAPGSTTQLSWSTSNATSCTASGGWSGSRATSGIETVGPLSAAATFTLSCNGAGGSGSASATVAVAAPPTVSLTASVPIVNPGQPVTLSWTATDATTCIASGAWSGNQPLSGSFTTSGLNVNSRFQLDCTGPGGLTQASVLVSVNITPTLPPAVRLDAVPNPVFEGSPVTLTWSSQSVAGCQASGAWSGPQGTSGAFSTAPLTSATQFTLTCVAADGSAVASSVTVTTVPPPAPTVSLGADRNSITLGTAVSLFWSSIEATTCEAGGAWSGARPTAGSLTLTDITATGTYTLTCTGRGGTGSASTTVTVTGPNTPPVANAGPDRSIVAGADFVLVGVASSDPGGNVVSYQWSQVSGPATNVQSPTQSVTQATAPVTRDPLSLTFQLVVTDNLGVVSAPDTVVVTVVPPAGGIVELAGRVTYERVPFSATLGQGLDYAAVRSEPSRGITVQLLNAGRSVIGETRTDADGRYVVDAPADALVFIRAVAELLRGTDEPLPRWDITVRDADRSLGVYAVESNPAPVVAGRMFDLSILAGWDPVTRRPNGARLAAPFAILDTIYRSIQTVVAVEPTADFPVLTVDWAIDNPAGETFYTDDAGGPNRRIVLAGQADADIDEYDPHTIAHEFGHYLEDRFSRSDSIGGPHSLGDRLDPRVAFGEGFGYAFAAIVMNDPVVRDALGAGQSRELYFNLESDDPTAEGWYSESSVWEIIWDLYDSSPDGVDAVAAGFAPIWNLLRGVQRDADGFTTIFQFISVFKQQNPALAAGVDAIVSGEAINAATIEPFALTETNDAQLPAVLPVYGDIAVGGAPVTVRSLADFGTYNKLANRRFLRLPSNSAQQLRITATTPGARDPDVIVWRRGVPVAIGFSPTNENFVVNVTPGLYILEVYDCGNAECGSDAPGPQDITVTVTRN